MRTAIVLVLALALTAQGCASWGTWSVNGVTVAGEGWPDPEERRRKDRERRTFWIVAGAIGCAALAGVVAYAVTRNNQRIG